LNKQAQQIEAMMEAKPTGEEMHRQPAQPASARQERRPWIEPRDWFSRQSNS
jgi:hypothetical protein